MRFDQINDAVGFAFSGAGAIIGKTYLMIEDGEIHLGRFNFPKQIIEIGVTLCLCLCVGIALMAFVNEINKFIEQRKNGKSGRK